LIAISRSRTAEVRMMVEHAGIVLACLEGKEIASSAGDQGIDSYGQQVARSIRPRWHTRFAGWGPTRQAADL